MVLRFFLKEYCLPEILTCVLVFIISMHPQVLSGLRCARFLLTVMNKYVNLKSISQIVVY